jgi:hypothetical protein
MREEVKKDVEIMIESAANRGGTIDYSTILNFFFALKQSEQTQETLVEIQDCFIGAGIEIKREDLIEDDQKGHNDIRPFNPALIDITANKITLESIFKRLKHGEINLNAEFQRKSDLWNVEQKSRLIESILLKIPLPAFYIDASKDDEWLIIDGLQRTSTLRSFAIDKSLRLEGLEFFKDFEGFGYDDLPRNFIRRIEETEINIFKVNPGTPENVKYNIFKRINTGGLKLEPQEIRNAMFQGTAATITKEMSQNQNFLLATDYRVRSERMADREFPTRFFAVCYVGIKAYDGVPDNYLNTAMIQMGNLKPDEADDVKNQFSEVMRVCYEIFGKQTFRKLADTGYRRPINKAIFEIWCRTIFHCSVEEREKLIERRDEVCSAFMNLCENDDSFSTALKSGDKTYFSSRFQFAEKIVSEVMSK